MSAPSKYELLTWGDVAHAPLTTRFFLVVIAINCLYCGYRLVFWSWVIGGVVARRLRRKLEARQNSSSQEKGQ